MLVRVCLAVALATLVAAPAARAQTGQQLYTSFCQGCHNFPGNNHNGVLNGKDWTVILQAINTVFEMRIEVRPFYLNGQLDDDKLMLIAGYLQTFPGGFARLLTMPATVDFGPVPVGIGSATLTRTIASTGNQAVVLAGTVASSNPLEFPVVSTTCTAGATLPPGSTCDVTLQFVPAATGVRGGQVDVASNGVGSPQSFALAGTGTLPGTPTTVPVVEYFNAGFGHYFMTADPDEIAGLDGGAFGGAFVRTGRQFNGRSTPAAGTVPVCRFFTTPGTFGFKSSHFYTASEVECEGLKLNPAWIYEKIAFHIAVPTAEVCVAGTVPVYRMFNNGQTQAPNHRFTTDLAIYLQFTTTMGWAAENIAFCAPP